MAKREVLIRLGIQERDNGDMYVSSPDVPLFHIVSPTLEMPLAILKETIELNTNSTVTLRAIGLLDMAGEDTERHPQFLIAEIETA